MDHVEFTSTTVESSILEVDNTFSNPHDIAESVVAAGATTIANNDQAGQASHSTEHAVASPVEVHKDSAAEATDAGMSDVTISENKNEGTAAGGPGDPPARDDKRTDTTPATAPRIYPVSAQSYLRLLEGMIFQYAQDLSAKVYGGPRDPAFLSKLEKLGEEFSSSLASTKPRIVNGETGARQPATAARPKPGKSTDCMDLEDTESWMNQSNPRKRQRENGNTPQSDALNRNKYTLEQIRDIRRATTMSRVPGEVDHRAKDPFIERVVKSWEPLIAAYLSSVNALVKQMAIDRFGLFFQAFDNMPVFRVGRRYVQDFLDAECQRVGEHVRYLYNLELGQIFTANVDEMVRHQKAALDYIMKMRARQLEDEKIQRLQRLAASTESSYRKAQIKEKIEEEYKAPDPFKDELIIMADVRAYNELAQRRFSDYCQMTIRSELVGRSLPRVVGYLEEKFQLRAVDAHEKARHLFVEDPVADQGEDAKMEVRESIVELETGPF
ncbi:hypothetical protein BJ508DRAFT_303502 [Ascobolus immersus RN42]|uniref:GED domain-containing protein n=1 Tax=Ascobolus immersus RN42 TaxID=1160509 RepID=A0A3N4IGJ7_ASCIM|nr:hypothetical protein BJ508DRAFT_303502 [Ascobolus immersus RN42]